jgi:hypothetical protein
MSGRCRGAKIDATPFAVSLDDQEDRKHTKTLNTPLSQNLIPLQSVVVPVQSVEQTSKALAPSRLTLCSNARPLFPFSSSSSSNHPAHPSSPLRAVEQSPGLDTLMWSSVAAPNAVVSLGWTAEDSAYIDGYSQVDERSSKESKAPPT